jgi:hypothetical protein
VLLCAAIDGSLGIDVYVSGVKGRGDGTFLFFRYNGIMGARDLIWLFTEQIPRKIANWTREFIQDKAVVFFQTRRKPVFLGLGGAALIVLLGFVGVALAQGHARGVRTRARAGELTESFKPLPIAPEDLFFPDEPDALPEFIPARPQRETWTAEDTAEYWTDPLAGKEALWRDRLGEAAEELLEAVP